MEALDWKVIDFECNLDKILLHSKDLIISVPTLICKLIDNQGNDGSKDDGKCKSFNDKNTGGGKNPRLNNAITNDKVNPNWKLCTDESYAKVFRKCVDSIPKFQDKPICAKFQICGAHGFSKDCTCKASHCILTNDVKSKMTSWVEKCHSEASCN
jgi:DNA-binding XRE family transcriptional regulator